jgi:uncharacterized protein (TIGR02266 family)
MSYSGAAQARQGREMLGQGLAALQEDPNIPPDVMAVAQNIAQAVGALFEAERASSEPDGKSCVRNALSSLSQTLALLQDVRGQHKGIAVATEVIAKVMSGLFPLTTVPSRMPPPPAQPVHAQPIPKASPVPQAAPQAHAPSQPQHAPTPSRGGKREQVEANIGATTESNFFVGFSGEIAEGGVFVATYTTHQRGTPVEVLVTLPGGFETKINGVVRFVRDSMDFGSESEPGMGVQFEGLTAEQRELILRFIKKRAPMFYDE